VLDIETFLPAVGQGAIALTARAGDARALAALAPIGHADTMTALTAERAFLAELEGSCRTPIAGHARLEGAALTLTGQVLREDGSEAFDVRLEGAPADAARLGAEAGRDLARRLPPGVLPSGKAPAGR
jgi:hydroxymethylbilane synthase